MHSGCMPDEDEPAVAAPPPDVAEVDDPPGCDSESPGEQWQIEAASPVTAMRLSAVCRIFMVALTGHSTTPQDT
jgi:hypothetical protein